MGTFSSLTTTFPISKDANNLLSVQTSTLLYLEVLLIPLVGNVPVTGEKLTVFVRI